MAGVLRARTIADTMPIVRTFGPICAVASLAAAAARSLSAVSVLGAYGIFISKFGAKLFIEVDARLFEGLVGLVRLS